MNNYGFPDESEVEFFVLKDTFLHESKLEQNKRNKFKDADIEELSHHVIGFHNNTLYVFNDYKDTKKASRLLYKNKPLGKIFHRMTSINVSQIEKVLYHPTLDTKNIFGSKAKGFLYGADIELYRNAQHYSQSKVTISSMWLLDDKVNQRLLDFLTIKGIFTDFKNVKDRPVPLAKDEIESNYIGTFHNLFQWDFHTNRWVLQS